MLSAESRGSSISKIAGNPAQLAALRLHLEEVVKGGVFGGSPRSQQFLRYVVEKSIEGDFDSLKERMIGVELFRRTASYDTGEDAVVRVTASDVRKRLQQHYGRYGDPHFRIELPTGSYIPEITSLDEDTPAPHVVPEPAAAVAIVELLPVDSPAKRFNSRAALVGAGSVLALVLVAAGVWVGMRIRKPAAYQALAVSAPWSTLLESGRVLQIVPSDPDFATIQDITGHAITLADYANEKYIPDSPNLSPEMRTFCQKYLRGARAADIDVPIVANIVSLASSQGSKVAIRATRQMRLADFQTDDDFILLGSPIANPWIELFHDQLDFRFHFSEISRSEEIENVHPRPKESKVYSSVAGGFESKPPTGATYAIVALLQNPNHHGHVLILAGVGAEATTAAANLTLNHKAFSDALGKCGQPSGALNNFEFLLRVGVMAGSPINTEVVACHALS